MAPAPSPGATTVAVTDRGLTAADVVAVARDGATVELTPAAREAMAASAALIDGFLAADEPVYGVTTGFGSLATTSIPPERTAELQVALVRSHAAGMGAPVEAEVVRAMVLLRARSLAMGRSGARPEVADGAGGAAQRRPHARRPRARLARSQRRPRAPRRGGDGAASVRAR